MSMQAYLDDYGLITVMIKKKNINGMLFFHLKMEKTIEELELIDVKEYKEYNVYSLKYFSSLLLHKKYTVVANNHLTCLLFSGRIIRTNRFDEEFYYDGVLGVTYTMHSSIFRIWSPVAHKITLVLDGVKHNLNYINKGLWEIEISGDQDTKAYYYLVNINGKQKRILDPYGLSSNANGMHNFVVDKEQFRKFKHQKPFFSGEYVDAILYEASVRDFSFHTSAKARYKGKFIGMLENHPTSSNLPTGLDYISYLGVTHLQLMPVFDFEGVDDTTNKQYNWGYNPHQYFVPCGWYATNPDDPYCRINELIQLIDGAHKRDLRVVLDVVFNHVFDYTVFPLETLVPGYFYRVDEAGEIVEVSGCQNDLATEKRMTRKLIVDNLVYFMKYFNVSGFRFDLMGLLDIETMLLIEKTLREIDDKVILYGEGWNMPNSLQNEMRSHMDNHHKFQSYAFFNDKFRDYMRGSQWHKTVGYILDGTNQNSYDLFHLICGSCTDFYKFSSPNQTINYVECHDNYTLYDFAKIYTSLTDLEIKYAAKLALGIILISQGIPFIHAGQEFLRTKDGIENSYNAGDFVNRFDYYRRDEHIDMVTFVKDLIQLRKELPGLRLNNAYDIMSKVHLIGLNSHCNSYGIRIENESNLVIYIKNSYQMENIFISETFWVLFDGKKKVFEKVYDNIALNEPGIYIYKKEV